jgi:hypothetical protein
MAKRIRWVSLLFASCLPSLSASGAPTGQPATLTLPQATCVAWGRTVGLKLQGTSESGGLSGSFEMEADPRTGRYVARRDYGIASKAEGFDGKLAWTRSWSGTSHYLDSAPAQAISTTEAWLRRRRWCEPMTDAPEITALPDETNSGVVDAVWRVTPRGGIAAILRFDRASGLLRQSELRHQFNRVLLDYAEWHDIGNGALVPMSQKIEEPEDESVESIELTSAKPQAQMGEANKFARPQLPRDHAILGNARSASVAYEDDGIGRIYVPLIIENKGPFIFEIDTGGHFILTPETASELHLNPLGNLSNSGAGPGVVHSGLVHMAEIRIGSAVIRNQVANVFPLSKSGNDRGKRPRRAGIIGPELFERFVVQLDRSNKILTLTPFEAFTGVPRGVSIPINFTEDPPEASGTFDGVGGNFMLDSGDAGPAIVYEYWAQEHGLAARLARGIAWSGSGVGGEFPNTLGRGEFTLGPLSFPHEVVSYEGMGDRGDNSTRMLAGTIGESSLYRFNMTYNYKRELVWIDPISKIAPRAYNRSGLDLQKDLPQSFAVTKVMPESAATVAGIKPGDRILSINGHPASQLGRTDALVTFAGPVGSDVEVLVVPKEGGKAQSKQLRLKEMIN